MAMQLPSSPLEAFEYGVAVSNFIVPSIFAHMAAFGFFIGDWSNQLGAEIKMFSKRPESLATFMTRASYVCARLGGLLALLMYVLVLSLGINGSGCKPAGKLLSVFTMIALGGSYSILTIRCMALWRHVTFICIFMPVFAVLTTLTTISQIITIDAAQSTVGSIVCDLARPEKIESLPYWAAFAFDSIVSVLTLMRLKSRRYGARMAASEISNTLLRDNAAYYLSVIFISLGSAILIVSPAAPYYSVLLSGTHVAVTVAMACRVVIHLQSLDRTMGTAGGSSGGAMDQRTFGAASNVGRGTGIGLTSMARTNGHIAQSAGHNHEVVYDGARNVSHDMSNGDGSYKSSMGEATLYIGPTTASPYTMHTHHGNGVHIHSTTSAMRD